MIHSQSVDSRYPWREMFVDFGPQLAAAFAAMGIIDVSQPVMHPGYDLNLVLQAVELFDRLRNGEQHLILDLVPDLISFHHTLVNRGRKGEVEDDSIRIACEALARRFDARFDIKTFCESRGWGYESFRKAFVKRMGISPGQYRIRYRLDRSSDLLLSRPDLSIAEIAARLGYSNANEFSAQFKRFHQMSPLRYRKTHLGE